jgi:hypothetical protein
MKPTSCTASPAFITNPTNTLIFANLELALTSVVNLVTLELVLLLHVHNQQYRDFCATFGGDLPMPMDETD